MRDFYEYVMGRLTHDRFEADVGNRNVEIVERNYFKRPHWIWETFSAPFFPFYFSPLFLQTKKMTGDEGL